MAEWAPAKGDVAWLELSPGAAHEQEGRRPVLVMSPHAYNSRVGLCVACPITAHGKGYPFEVRLPDDAGVIGVVLADHVRSLDWRARRAKQAGTVPPEVVAEVWDRLRTLLECR